jgi:hypothetical protein
VTRARIVTILRIAKYPLEYKRPTLRLNAVK